MEVTIQNCKALLRKGGLLIANELSAKTEFLTLTFGLTEGWWLYDDVQRRIPGKSLCPCFVLKAGTFMCCRSSWSLRVQPSRK